MKILRRIFTVTAPVGLGVLLLAGSASASTIFAVTTATGNIPGVAAPADTSTSAATFNQTTVNGNIQSGCASGFTCSALTVYEIDFTLTTNISGTLNVTNGQAGTVYLGPITGQAGTFGSPTSGVVIENVDTINLIDPDAVDLVDTLPSVNVASNTGRKANCTAGGTAGNFANCLSVASGPNNNYSGNGTDTQTGVFLSSDSSLTAGMLARYVTAADATVIFDVATDGVVHNNGSLPLNVSESGTANLLALTNGLVITYKYSYDSTATSLSPEPSTMILFGGALLGLGVIGRKRNRS